MRVRDNTEWAELMNILKVNAQPGQSGAVNKPSVKSTSQNDYFQELKRRKVHRRQLFSTLNKQRALTKVA
jgi:hypothetical protein